MQFRADQKERLDKFLARMVPEMSRTKLAAHIEKGGVAVNGEAITKPRYEVVPDQTVVLAEFQAPAVHNLAPVPMDLDIRYEDDDLIVVNKPRGIAVHPAPSARGATLIHGLLARSHDLSTIGGDYRPGIVHRLDKDTTGLMIVAKNDKVHVHLADQLKTRTLGRKYVAVIYRIPEEKQFVIEGPIGRHPKNPTQMAVVSTGKPAVTHVKVLAHSGTLALIGCRLETGRTHQIRVHLSSIGCPVIGDKAYAPKSHQAGEMALHAAVLRFVHPVTGKEVEVSALPPDDFQWSGDIPMEELIKWK